MALDAISDDDVRAELANVQRDRDAALLATRDGELARSEHVRRTEQAASDAEAERKRRERAAAAKLDAEYREKARAVDDTASAFAQALKAFAGVELDLQATLGRADETFRRPAGSAPTAALVYQMRAHGVPPGMIETAGINPRAVKLVNSLPRSASRE